MAATISDTGKTILCIISGKVAVKKFVVLNKYLIQTRLLSLSIQTGSQPGQTQQAAARRINSEFDTSAVLGLTKTRKGHGSDGSTGQ